MRVNVMNNVFSHWGICHRSCMRWHPMIPQIEGMYWMMWQSLMKSLVKGGPIPFRSTVGYMCSVSRSEINTRRAHNKPCRTRSEPVVGWGEVTRLASSIGICTPGSEWCNCLVNGTFLKIRGRKKRERSMSQKPGTWKATEQHVSNIWSGHWWLWWHRWI